MASFDPKSIKGLIFDYGGTLDSRGTHWSIIIREGWTHAGVLTDEATFRQAYVEAEREMARNRHVMPDDTFLDMMRTKITLELQWLTEQGKFNPSEIADKAEAVARYCYEAARRCTSESASVLSALASRYPMVLVSNFYGNIKAVLADFGLDKFFSDIIESSVVGVRKPDPEIFRLGVKALGMPADSILVVGDSYRKDILPARAAGCATLWLKGRGWTQEEDDITDLDAIEELARVTEILGVSSIKEI